MLNNFRSFRKKIIAGAILLMEFIVYYEFIYSPQESAVLTFLLVATYVLLLWDYIDNVHVYKKINNNGTVITGILKKYKFSFFTQNGFNASFCKTPIVSINNGEQEVELEAISAIYIEPIKIGESINVIFNKDFPANVVFKDIKYEISYIRNTIISSLVYLIILILFIVIL